MKNRCPRIHYRKQKSRQSIGVIEGDGGAPKTNSRFLVLRCEPRARLEIDCLVRPDGERARQLVK